MIARYENKALKGRAHVSAHQYGDLQNLPHWHTEYELVFTDRGSAEVLVGSTIYTLTEETCVFIRSGEVHYIKAERGSILSVIKIDTELIHTALGKRLPVGVLHPKPSSAADTFAAIAAELSGGQEYRETISDCLAIRLLAELFRSVEMTGVRRAQSGSDEKYKQLLHLISERYAYITFADAAEFMCFSQPYFSKYFTRMSGMTFTEYLNIVRVNEVIRLLGEKRCTMTEIAVRTGFGTIRSFNRVFKSVTGYTPRSLPEGYVFFVTQSDGEDAGVDPTLSAVLLV